VYIVHRIRMASQQRAVAVTPVGLQLLTGGQAWLREGSHCPPGLGEGGTGLVGRHGRARRRRVGRQLKRQASNELPALLAGELMR